MRLARLCFLLAVLSFIPLRSSAKSDETVQSERLRRRAELSVRLNSIGSFAQKQVFLAELGDTTQSSHGAAGSIAGKVYGLDLSAVGTAYAEAWKADTLGMEWDKGLALIDSNFTYSIDGLSPGEYYVTVWADGYDTQYYNGASDLSGASHVAVVEDLTTGGIDFHLIRTAPGTGGISGIVRDVSDGKPVAGAVVSVWGSDFSGPYRFGKAECDSEGRYSVTGLKSGGYYAQVFADGYVWEMYEDAEDVRLAKPIRVDEPNTAAGIDFSIEKGGTLSGKVVDVSGKPYYKAVVIALTGREGMIPSPDDSTFSYEFGKIQRTGIADTNGVYVIDGLKKGAYLVVASVQTEGIFQELWYDQAPSMQEADSVAVRSGETTDGIDFRFSPPAGYGSLSGTIVDIDGRAIAGASVSIQEMSISAWDRNWRTVQTDSFGAYQSGYLRPGEYIVSCYAQMGWRSITRWWPDADAYEKAETVHLDPDGSVTGVDFRLPLRPGRSSISGTVQSSDGRLLVHASVQIQSRPLPGSGNDDLPSVWAYASTDSSGRYNVRDLSADTYTVYATHWEGDQFGQEWYNHKSGEASADPLVLQENQQASGVDFTLTVKPIYGSVAGTVRDSLTKQPIKRAYVHITPLSFGTGFRSIMVWNLQTTTDQNGQYAFERLTEGEYLISVYSNGGFAYYKNAPVPDMADTVIVEGGVRKQADVSLLLRNDGGGSISGQITSGWPWYKTGSDSLLFMSPISSRPPILLGASIPIAVVTAKPAVTIQSYPQSELFYTAVTDSEGTYTLNGLPPGEYIVSSFAPYCMLKYYKDATDPAEAKLVWVEKDSPTTGIDIALLPMLYVMNWEPGMRTEGTTSLNGKVLDSDGNALSGASVYILDYAGRALTFATSAGDGSYEVGGLPPGNYIVQASKPGYKTAYNGTAEALSQTVPMNVTSGVNTLDFTLQPGQTTGVRDAEHNAPESVALLGCYPNPFNPETRIAFTLPERMRATVTVFNSLGQEVAVLCDRIMEAGRRDLVWKALDRNGMPLPSGLYFYRLETASATKTGKMMLMR